VLGQWSTEAEAMQNMVFEAIKEKLVDYPA
jgi:hypothetical protein